MTGFSAIDLAKLPAPNIVEALGFETIFEEMRADLVERDPGFSALLESDPATKILQVAAYREMLLRQSFNDRARAVLIAKAKGSDLDHLAAFFRVQRRVIDPGDPQALPPVPPVMEDDESLRLRVHLAPEAFSTAGPKGSYVFHTLSAGQEAKSMEVATPEPGVIVVTYRFSPVSTAAKVKDVHVDSPEAGDVVVTVLSREGDGAASAELLAMVNVTLSDEDVRPTSEHVIIQSASVIHYQVVAELEVYDGPDAHVVLTAARASLSAFVETHHRLGDPITESGLHAALHIAGVRRVMLIEPAATIEVLATQAAYCTGMTVTLAGGVHG